MITQTIPRHIGIIMDGNRRWARKRLLPVVMGHKEGSSRIEPVVKRAIEKGITHLTFWAFSTENWRREQDEVNGLMDVFRNVLQSGFIDILMKHGVRICVLGDMKPFPEDIKKRVEEMIASSKDNNKITVNFALNYGGRDEIIHAIKQLVQKGEEITEEAVANNLYTSGQPDPDLIIRTGGEQRLSGFLAWQGVYAELYFPDIYWPDFDEKEFDKALEVLSQRQRRFGK